MARGLVGSRRGSRAVKPIAEMGLGEVEFAVVDLETTGVWTRDRVIEVAARRVDLSGNVLAEFETLINPGRTAANNLEIHGIRDQELRDAPSFEDISGDLSEVLNGAVWAAHNAPFDKRFLFSEFGRIETVISEWPTVCTMRLASAIGRPADRTLAACCEYFGIRSDGDAHQAMSDVRATTTLLLTLLSPRSESCFGELYGTEGAEWHAPLPELRAVRPPTGRVHRRGEVREEITVSPLIALGAGSDPKGVRRYLERLSEAMDDRLIEGHEIEDLIRIAAEENISPSQVQEAHAVYFQNCVSRALADGRIDQSEENDLARVAVLLGIEPEQIPELTATAPAPQTVQENALEGMTICFTGEVDATVNGRPVTRRELTDAAISRGMVPKSGVSRKLNLLVTADPYSLSGKARKARELGTRIITAAAFLAMIGMAVD